MPSQGTKILQAAQHGQKKKKKRKKERFNPGENHFKKGNMGASLVAQWLRVCLPMQGTRV